MESTRLFVGATSALLASASVAATNPTAPSVETVLLAKSLQPWITANISGAGRVDCIADIGANYSVLPSRLLREAKYVRNVKVDTASGPVGMQIKQVDWVQVDSASASKIDFLEQDRSWFDPRDEMPCVLGTNFLKNFTVDFDGPAGKVRLFPRGTRTSAIVGSAASAKYHVKAYFGTGDLVTTNVRIQGQTALADIDTGWGLATPNAALLHALGLQQGDTRVTTKWIGSPLTGNGREYQVAQFPELYIGGISEKLIDVVMPEARTQEMALGERPHIQLGWGMLRAHRMIVDWKNKDMVLMP
jgi:hypothetical protein